MASNNQAIGGQPRRKAETPKRVIVRGMLHHPTTNDINALIAEIGDRALNEVPGTERTVCEEIGDAADSPSVPSRDAKSDKPVYGGAILMAKDRIHRRRIPPPEVATVTDNGNHQS